MVWVKIGSKVKYKLTFIYAQDFNSCLLGGSPVFDPPKHPLMWTFLSLYTTLKKNDATECLQHHTLPR